jgi:hypothetical protein
VLTWLLDGRTDENPRMMLYVLKAKGIVSSISANISKKHSHPEGNAIQVSLLHATIVRG